MKRSLLFSVALLCGLFLLSGWGFLVHRTVNQLAVYQLPKDLRQFFYANKEYIVRNSVRPDERRNSDKTEAPKHFIDAEPYGDSSLWKMPYHWEAAVAKYTKDSLEKYGYVPYVVMNMKVKLTNAMRAGNKDSILFYAADLGHYIADAHVPLHTTENYDGQLSNQRGLHSLWESTVPELELTNYNLYQRHRARYLKNPEESIWNACRGGFQLLDGVLNLEKEVSKNFTDSTKYRYQMRNGRQSRSYTSAFARAYGKALGTTVNDRLLASARLISDFWYTCWVDAGKPKLNANAPALKTAERKKELRSEVKAFKQNELLKQDLLMARKQQGGREE
ncbi:S1/P1 Nuclease [Cnuella takakiae]|uniref:S1/P1 Nuclease n=1 Tax=Cnuella takakiae TaxID=1302690 RepID=A0A1M5J7S0_9BACT|nr:zinc dependent phospholipase C family protein [Cnuella takakiae]OLY91759.1 hypothetical protein BUE76_07485 [Cnuella takakiae]SHG36592.1 S1/P1 Nuclease [Cnuella takakiae]